VVTRCSYIYPRPIVDLQQEPVLDARQVRVAGVAHQPHPALGCGEREARQVVLLAEKLDSQFPTIFTVEKPCDVLLRMCRPPGRPRPWSTAAGLPRPPHRHCCCCCRRPRALVPPPSKMIFSQPCTQFVHNRTMASNGGEKVALRAGRERR